MEQAIYLAIGAFLTFVFQQVSRVFDHRRQRELSRLEDQRSRRRDLWNRELKKFDDLEDYLGQLMAFADGGGSKFSPEHVARDYSVWAKFLIYPEISDLYGEIADLSLDIGKFPEEKKYTSEYYVVVAKRREALKKIHETIRDVLQEMT